MIIKDLRITRIEMSKIIIDEHCLGNLSVKNSTKGATFEIKLPIKI